MDSNFEYSFEMCANVPCVSEFYGDHGPARFLLTVEFFELVEQFVDTKLRFSHEFVKY